MAKKKMKLFTVIGYYPDNDQRYGDCFEAESADKAERMAPSNVKVCGVIEGDHKCVDTETDTAWGGSAPTA